jgi:serine/threonine-protein kinase
LAAWRRSLPGLRPVSLREPAGEGSGVVERPKSPELPPPGAAGRYQLFGEIARGGMGAVLRGRDPDLGRDIAIKVLREDHRANPRMVERFIEEAQVCGQLQHPGVPPVHEFGTFADGRPYFTMKLVKGRTLAAEFADRSDPADGRARLLGVFAQICQTMAYAHAKGVVHRDLKPANVMVGTFGEVQVMDWGLAKVLASGGIDDELKASRGRKPPADDLTSIKTVRSVGSTSETQAGSLLGTPAYMAPEQARGDVDLLDERCDVFGLGAVLCELLTGQPPYAGESAGEVQRRAAVAALDDAFARLDGCGADAELVALAKRCLAAEPWDRPRDAKAVADAVTAYLTAAEERVRRAERDRAVAEARAAEERKRRRVTVALAASSLLLLGLGGGGTWWLRERRAEVTRAVELALRQAEQLRMSEHYAEALSTLQKAEALLPGVGDGALAAKVRQDRADVAVLVRLDEIRLKATAVDPQAGRFNLRRTVPLYKQAFRDYGIDVTALSEGEAADQVRNRSIRAQLLAALDEWWCASPAGADRDHLLRVATAADPEPDGLMNRLRQAVAREDSAAIRRLTAEGNLRNLTPATLSRLGWILGRTVRAPEEAVRVLTLAQEPYPGDFWINHELAFNLERQKLPRREEAIRYYTAALAIRRTPGAYFIWRSLSARPSASQKPKPPTATRSSCNPTTRRPTTTSAPFSSTGTAPGRRRRPSARPSN